MTSLSDYYRSYYNHNHFRHVTYVTYVPKGQKTHDLKFHPEYDHDLPYEKFRKFLINNKHQKGNLYAAISYYPNYAAYSNDDKSAMITDRLFFDFDMDKTDNAAANDLMSKIKRLYEHYQILTDDGQIIRCAGKKRDKILNSYRKQYKQLILKEDLLLPVYDEVMRFISELQDGMKLRPYLTLSGSSGFHVNLFMPDQELPYIEYTRKQLHNIFRDKLHLRFQDPNVLDVLSRKQRVPYTLNPKTNLIVQPLPSDISYDEVLKIIDRNSCRPEDFTVEDYYVTDEFIEMLHYFDKRGKAEAVKEKEKQQQWMKKYKRTAATGKIFEGQINITKPEDAAQLLSFKCFNEMPYDDYNNLLLVNLLWNTYLPDAESVQKAMVYVWHLKGREMQLSETGLKRVKANMSGKYAPTNNTMKKKELCQSCNWKECFRYKLHLKPDYRERIAAYKEKHS